MVPDVMFSVVIPLWNKRPTIAAAVASVLAQEYRGFELIVVDDGSTDGGAAELAAFDDPRIRLLVQPNYGPGPARNAGIAASVHDWIAFLDADDLWFPEHLDELDRVRRLHPGAGLIGSAYVPADRNGRYRLRPSSPPRIESVNYLERMERGALPITTSSVAVARSVYRALGGFGTAPAGQDIEYWARIALDREVAVSSRVTSVYRLGTGGISDSIRSLWYGRTLAELKDLEPSIALMVSRYPTIPAERRPSVDRFIDGRLRQCIRTSARIGDLPTLRTLRRLKLRRTFVEDRMVLALSALPAPAATAAYWLGFRLKALRRAVKTAASARVSSTDPRAPGWRAAGRRRAGG